MKAENKRRSLKIEDNDYDHLSKSKIVHLIDSDVKIRLELDISLVPKSEHFTDADLKSWTKYLEIDHPFKCLALQKFKEKTKQLIRKYIPSQLRNKIWPLLIHDRLALTRPFYNDLLENNVLPEKVKSQIAKDIDRSFPNNGELNSCKDLLSNMQEMLEEFHCYRPDISYVQGMTYPAAILLLVTLDKFVAFKCFCNIIVSNELLRSLYSFDLKKVVPVLIVDQPVLPCLRRSAGGQCALVVRAAQRSGHRHRDVPHLVVLHYVRQGLHPPHSAAGVGLVRFLRGSHILPNSPFHLRAAAGAPQGEQLREMHRQHQRLRAADKGAEGTGGSSPQQNNHGQAAHYAQPRG